MSEAGQDLEAGVEKASSWAAMVDRALGSAEAMVEARRALRREVSDDCTVFRDAWPAAAGDQVVAYRQRDHGAFLDLIADARVRDDFAEKMLVQMARRLDALEGRIEKAGPPMSYRGVWVSGSYEAGNTVTYKGSLWYCRASTGLAPDAIPSDGEPRAWQLAAKRGADGKDAAR